MISNNPIFSSNQTLSDDVVLCLKTLFSITAGTQPLDRDFGIDADILNQPLDVAQNLFTLEAIEKVEQYIPSVEVVSVDFETDAVNGQLIPHIRLKASESEEDNNE